MFSRVKSFVKNHWKKAVIGGITVQLVNYGVRYAANRMLQYQEAQAQELWQKMKKLQHFESTEETFIATYLSLLPKLQETIVHDLDTEGPKNLLKNKTISNKLEIWEELKVIAFSRIIVTIYSTSILNVLLRIQLNVIGGYLFLESGQTQEHAWRNVNGVILSNTTAIDTDLQQKYLSLANYFVREGLSKLCAHVYEKTKNVVKDISLKQKLTIRDLERIFWTVINDVKGPASTHNGPRMHPATCPWKYTFPQDLLDKYNYFQDPASKFHPHYIPPDIYEHLLNETFDLLDSDDVRGILKAFESHGISHFLDRISDSLNNAAQSTTSPTPNSEDDNSANMYTSNISTDSDMSHGRSMFQETSAHLAKIIPIMNGFVDTCMVGSDPWIVLLATADNVRVLGANVYESFSTKLNN